MTIYTDEVNIYNPDAIKGGVDRASSTATNYITQISNEGIKVHASTLKDVNYQRIDAGGSEVFVNGKSAAKFGPVTRIGAENGSHTVMSNAGFDYLYGDTSYFAVEPSYTTVYDIDTTIQEDIVQSVPAGESVLIVHGVDGSQTVPLASETQTSSDDAVLLYLKDGEYYLVPKGKDGGVYSGFDISYSDFGVVRDSDGKCHYSYVVYTSFNTTVVLAIATARVNSATARIGKRNGARALISNVGFELKAGDDTYFRVKDLRDDNGLYTEILGRPLGLTFAAETFPEVEWEYTITNYKVKLASDGSDDTSNWYLKDSSTIARRSEITSQTRYFITLTTNSEYARSFTFGHRMYEDGGEITDEMEGGLSASFGMYTSATGSASFSEGERTSASGDCSHAQGVMTSAEGYSSHAEGTNTIASGDYSHTEGSGTNAIGYGSHAEGDTTIARGRFSHAEGANTTASGYYSHAEGWETTANGIYSHVEGWDTNARGACSHAQNRGTIALAACQTVLGRYNVEDAKTMTFTGDGSRITFSFIVSKFSDFISITVDDVDVMGKVTRSASPHGNTDTLVQVIFKEADTPADGAIVKIKYSPGEYALIIGNGTNDNYRSNALAVKWNGDVEIDDGRIEISDSGWQTATLSSSFAVYSTNRTPKYRKLNGMVEIRGAVKPTSTQTLDETNLTIFTLPDGYQPGGTCEVTALCQASGRRIWLLSVHTDGKVTASRLRDMAETTYQTMSSTGSGEWMIFDVVFMAAE